MNNCDLCNLEVTGDWGRFSSSQMAAAVSAGLRPPDSSIEALRAALGLSFEDAQARWYQRVMTQQAYWSVCADCSRRIGSFLIQSPPPGYATSQPPSQGMPTPQSPPYGYGQPSGYPSGYSAPPTPPSPASPYSVAPSYGASYESYYPAPKTDGFAVASLVLGLIPCTCIPSILAVIFGHISLSRINASPELYSGRTMAMWGTGLGYFFIACNILYVLIVFASNSRHF